MVLPGGARVAIWTIVNVEEWDISRTLPRTVLPLPGGGSRVPDITNYGWYDYGLRVGFWRLRDVLARHRVRAAMAVNGSICTSYPRLVEAALESKWEIVGHGFIQRPLPLEPDERAAIRRTVASIRRATGAAPRGWLSPGLAETWDTLDLLAEEGIEYVADWANDDQPYEMRVKRGRLVSVPYSLEINDIPMFLAQHHAAEELFRRTRDQFDTLFEEGKTNARVLPIAVHPYITGVPHRIKYFDMIYAYLRAKSGVLFWTGAEILDWFKRAC
ncbi:MAG TPA: polysaccharide deacetylase family protein [bacterium]|nr:polysaccharide deacetylase family protein [bacterium]